MTTHIDTLLLLALPASGKSELRRYLAHLDDGRRLDDFGVGTTVQLDDFPYVHLMRRISQEARAAGIANVFFAGDEQPMVDARDWGMLIELIGQDWDDLRARRGRQPARAGDWMLDRFDEARRAVGAPAATAPLPADVRARIGRALDREVGEPVHDFNAALPPSFDGRTVVIEFARGGPEGASLPLPAPLGYRHSLSLLRPDILERAAVLYVWVTPEESRRKNRERANPDDPGSILAHGVPEVVMRGDYGCDDMEWLLAQSDRPDTVRVEAHGRVFHVPVARFDNRQDKTSFLRGDPARWAPGDLTRLHADLTEAFGRLRRAASR